MSKLNNNIFDAQTGVLLRSDKFPRAGQLQEWLSRCRYPCVLDEIELDDSRSLLSGRFLGSNVIARYRCEQISDCYPYLFESQYVGERDLNVVFDYGGSHSSKIFQNICMHGLAEVGNGVVWTEYFPRPNSIQNMERMVCPMLADLMVLKNLCSVNLDYSFVENFPSFGASKIEDIRDGAVWRLRYSGMIEPIHAEMHREHPKFFRVTEYGRDFLRNQ